jgi:hypothetical protein
MALGGWSSDDAIEPYLAAPAEPDIPDHSVGFRSDGFRPQ